MIVYLFDNYFFNKVVLPVKINGVYPLYMNDRTFLGNIEEKDGKWNITLGENITFNSTVIEEIKINTNFILENKNINAKYYVFVTSIYENYKKYSILKDTFKIGNESSCDIYYNFPDLPNDIIEFNYKDGKWNVNTLTNNLFISNSRIKNAGLYNGEHLFYYGLKTIIVNKTIMINDNNLIKLNNSFQELTDDKKMEIIESIVPDDTPLYSKDDYYFKSPRFNSVIEEENVIIDEPPEPIQENDMPAILTIGPQLTMVSTSVLSLVTYIHSYLEGQATKTRFIISICTISITIIGALLWPTLTRILNNRRLKKKEQKRQEKYGKYLEKKRHEIALLKNKQRQIIMENVASLENCKIVIDAKSRTLWERNIDHEDFLQVRLGIGTVSTKIKIDVPQEKFTLNDEDVLYTTLQEIVDDSLNIKGVPLSLNLVKNNITALVGRDDLTKQFLDGIFLQIMTFHAYTELKIIVYTQNKKKWDYLKILPHCWDNQKSIRYYATNSDEMNTISTELEKEFDFRTTTEEEVMVDENGKDIETEEIYKNYKPYYLIFTDDINAIRNIPIVKKVLKYKKNAGFSLLMLNDRLSTLPSETTTFINIDEQISGLVTNELSTNNQKQFTAELNKNIDIYECAQKLANLPIHVEKEKYELPSSLSFLEMYGVGKVEQLNISERWLSNNPVNSLAIPIGIDQNGELFKMDIHEKAYGPHGLVAGTTGSGKSEWIITLILSLSVNFNPDEVQFVLIDYKGGGLALSFENSELKIKLPHLAGTITNLDKSEINRSIASMESELKRRQAIFNVAREKLKEGSMNIYKYQQFYRKGMVSEPLSHLLIICDEFAELKQQQPEFMDQLISISRIGRSLGVHLILATQKPSGVVNDQIWSNSKFKVCLKVQDKSDSNEILKKPDAAFLKQTGAFYLEVGNDDYYNLGQSAWAGAKYFPSDVLKKKIDQSVQYIDNIGRTVNFYDDESMREEKKTSQGEELLNIVQYIDSLTKKETYQIRQLWLKNVNAISYISDLTKKYSFQTSKFKFNIPIGEYDEPRKQEQGLLELDLLKGNIAIIGQVGSGKENLISTIVWSSIISHTPNEINYYIIDFGSETLKRFSKFPHVGEVVFQDELDRVAGVVELIMDELERRKELFSDYNGSYEYYIRNSGKTLPFIVVVINSFDILSETLTKLSDLLNTLFRDAPKYGIIFIVSASSPSALRSRQLQYFYNTIMLQVQDETSYRSVTNCRRDLLPSKIFGRGISKITDEDDSYCEFQTAFIAPEDQAYEYIKNTADKLVEYYSNFKAKQLAKIPENVSSDDLVKYITNLENVPIGYNFYEKNTAKYNFLDEKIHLITSKALKENIEFIYGLTAILSKVPNVKVRVVDMLSLFKKPMLDIKLFNDDLNTVIGALENDVLTRTDTQDFAINIIIGAAQYKKTLTKGGVEIYQNIFDKLPSSKKSIYILIDEYEKLRSLKLEPWYSAVNTTKGLWLGSGFSSQSIFSSNELTPEDKKYDFKGLAYSIKDAKYTVIKTLMDGDE